MNKEYLIKCNGCKRIYFLTTDKSTSSTCQFMRHKPSTFSLLTKEEIENIPIGITISGIYDKDIVASLWLDNDQQI
jgi:hypothetical protein